MTASAALCDKGTTPHPPRVHGTDGQSHAHNPWSATCIRNLPGEPTCPDAHCWTCDDRFESGAFL